MKSNSKDLTDFEWQVLRASLTIPLGETRSYKWIANKIGSPRLCVRWGRPCVKIHIR